MVLINEAMVRTVLEGQGPDHHVRRMVVLQGMRLAIAGVIVGLVASFGLTRLMASFLYGVQARDPVVFVVMPLVLTIVSLLAVWLPARRASTVSPLTALRAE